MNGLALNLSPLGKRNVTETNYIDLMHYDIKAVPETSDGF
jgi:hypothetical protein